MFTDVVVPVDYGEDKSELSTMRGSNKLSSPDLIQALDKKDCRTYQEPGHSALVPLEKGKRS